MAAVDSSGQSGWVANVAAGAALALVLGTAVRPRRARRAGSVMRQVEAGWTALQTELARSRRHDRRFAIVGIPELAWTAAAAAPAERGFAAASAATTVQGLIRRPDRAWADGSMLYVLLTDCDADQAATFMQRARAAMPQLFTNAGVKLVVFPDDGITLGALLSGLRPEPADERVPLEAPTVAATQVAVAEQSTAEAL
jgi:hypothetical protein